MLLNVHTRVILRTRYVTKAGIMLLACVASLLPSLASRARHASPHVTTTASAVWHRRGAIHGAISFASLWTSPFGGYARWASAMDAAEPDNIFGRILRGQAPADVVEDRPDSGLFVFRDNKPASQIHLLVIPRRFIRDASRLEPSDAELVRDMEAKAKELVRAEVGSSFSERELALGFHWPPWYSVPWLHLHAIYPKSAMRRRYKYTAFSFYSPERVLLRLEDEKSSSAEK